MLERVMAEVGVKPEMTVMVGDTVEDLAMARAARTAAVGVGWGCHGAEELRDAGAVGLRVTSAGLPEVLERTLSGLPPRGSARQ